MHFTGAFYSTDIKVNNFGLNTKSRSIPKPNQGLVTLADARCKARLETKIRVVAWLHYRHTNVAR